jgi:hypothetical protein
MEYCHAAQREGKCKQDKLNGLFRGIEVNKGFKRNEFDIQFLNQKIYIGEANNNNFISRDVGDVKTTGSTDSGGVTFEVTNWKADSKIWPHEKMYGIYEKYYGELGIFNFAEIAISDKPIKSLDEGLNKDGNGLYFVSWNCKDD